MITNKSNKLYTTLGDGLYRVCTNRLCAGFVVRNHRIVLVAPILRKSIGYYKKLAVKVQEYKGD